jgi:hypothetical protein
MNPDDEIDDESLKAIDEGLAQIARGEDRDFKEFAAEFRKEMFGDFEPGELDELCDVERGDAIDGEEVFREIDALRDAASKREDPPKNE